MVRSLTKLSMWHTWIANAIPNAIAKTINRVFSARTIPTSIYPSSISLTKLMSGTPGTMKRAQAINGCHGVSECMKPGRLDAMAGSNDKKEVNQAIKVATKAEMPIAT